MTKTKDQMLQNAINAVIAYKQTCKLGVANHKEEYADAKMAVAAYANFSGISYDKACNLVMETIR